MASLTITKVKIGRGLAGSRIALVFAPPHAPPGSLTLLTRFFNEQEHLRAIPGYHGPNKNHVLRISGLKDDNNFLRLLQEDLPQWLQQNGYPKDILNVPAEITPEPIDEVDHFPHQHIFRRFIKENANSLTSLAFIAGNFGLFASAMRKSKSLPGQPNRDWFKGFSSLAYNIASASLIVLGHQADNPRDVYTIMEKLYPKLKEADAQHKEQIYSTAEKTLAFLQNHPWETAAAINLTGASAHLYSAARRHIGGAPNAKYELLAVLSTITSALITAFVPEKDGRDLSDLSSVFERSEEDSILHSVDQMEQTHSLNNPNHTIFDHFKDWIHNKPLAASALFAAMANTGYGVAALTRQPTDFGLLAASGLYLTGSAIQTQATKGRGPGFDDVVTAAAAIIRSDPKLKDMTPEEFDKRIGLFADALIDEREIVHSKRRLKKGISERLKRYELPQHEGEILVGFIPSEQQMLMKSPFVSPHYVEYVLRTAQKTNAARG